MYKKLEEYSNKYVSVYANDKRLVLDFKYPRLFHKNQSGAFGLGSYSGAVNESSLSNFLTYDRNNYEYVPVNTTGTTALTVNGTSSITSNSITISNNLHTQNHSDEDVIDIKKLVISSKTAFGRIYLIDSGDRVVRVYKRKLVENPSFAQELFRFFTQFNKASLKLIAAAILPKEKITPEEISKFETAVFTLGAYLGDTPVKSYLWSFLFPVLADCKYYEWASADEGIISNLISRYSSIENTQFYKGLKTSTTLHEFYKNSFGVKGSAFLKKILTLSQGKIEHVAGISEIYKKEYLKDTTLDTEAINAQLAAGKPLKSFSINENGAMHLQTFKSIFMGEDSGLRKSSLRINYASYSPFSKPYKVETFFHLGAARMWEVFGDLVPIDYWFNLKHIPSTIYSLEENQKKTIREWLSRQTEATKKKVFLTYNNTHELTDTINQLNEYSNPESLPEDIRRIYPNGLKPSGRWKTVRELHDEVSRDYNRIKHFAKNRKIKYPNAVIQRLHGLDFGNGFTSELPMETIQIIGYGADLKHCVAGYADRCADNNDTIILSINKDGNPHFTLELNKTSKMLAIPNDNLHEVINTHKEDMPPQELSIEHVPMYNVGQFKGLQNKVPKAEEVKDILQGLKDSGLIEYIREPYESEKVVTGSRARLMINGQEVAVAENVEFTLPNAQADHYAVYGRGLVDGVAFEANNIQAAINEITVPPEPPIEPMPDQALQHLVNALQDPAQHDNITIRDQDGVLADAANNNR